MRTSINIMLVHVRCHFKIAAQLVQPCSVKYIVKFFYNKGIEYLQLTINSYRLNKF